MEEFMSTNKKDSEFRVCDKLSKALRAIATAISSITRTRVCSREQISVDAAANVIAPCCYHC